MKKFEQIKSELCKELGHDAEAVMSLQAIGYSDADQKLLLLQQKYPQYKVVTGKKIAKICAKYNLQFGPLRNFVDDVPALNARFIGNFIKQYYRKYYTKIIRRGWFKSDIYENIELPIDSVEDVSTYDTGDTTGKNASHEFFIICSPGSYVDGRAGVGGGFDPIVLACEDYDHRRDYSDDNKYESQRNKNNYFIIVTAWGENIIKN